MTLGQNERNTILAALRYWQYQLDHGKAATGQALRDIANIAGEGKDFASPEDIDDLCEKINTED